MWVNSIQQQQQIHIISALRCILLCSSLSLCRSPHHTGTFPFFSLHIVCTECYRTEDEQQPRTKIVNKNNMRLRLISISSNLSCIQHMHYFEREKRKTFRRFRFFQVMVLFSFFIFFFACLVFFGFFWFFRFHFFIEKWRSFEFL